MNYKAGFIKIKNRCVVHRTGRGSVLPLAACMVLSALFCPVVLAQGVFVNATIASDGPAVGIDGVLGDAVSVFSFAHVIGGGSDRILVVGASAEGIGLAFDTVVTGVTYNGVAMTAVNSAVADNGPGLLATLHFLLESQLPAAGSNLVEVTYSTGPISLSVAAISLRGFVQQAPEAMAFSAAPDNTGTTTANITTVTDGAWLINLIGAGDWRVAAGDAFANSSAMTVRVSEERGTQDTAFATRIVGSAGAQAITWTYPSPNRMAQVVAAFEAIPPIFAILPQGGAREIGSSITFEVALFAPVGVVSHQWKKDGGDVGTDSPTLELTNLQLTDTGDYWVEVTDDNGTFITPPTTLTVIESLPTAGLWGLVFLAVLLLVSGTYFAKRRLARQ